MKAIDRKLLFHLVDVVWGVANEDESVPSTDWAREMIQKAIERRRGEKYGKQKLNLPYVSKCVCSNQLPRKTGKNEHTCMNCTEIIDSGC